MFNTQYDPADFCIKLPNDSFWDWPQFNTEHLNNWSRQHLTDCLASFFLSEGINVTKNQQQLQSDSSFCCVSSLKFAPHNVWWDRSTSVGFILCLKSLILKCMDFYETFQLRATHNISPHFPLLISFFCLLSLCSCFLMLPRALPLVVDTVHTIEQAVNIKHLWYICNAKLRNKDSLKTALLGFMTAKHKKRPRSQKRAETPPKL